MAELQATRQIKQFVIGSLVKAGSISFKIKSAVFDSIKVCLFRGAIIRALFVRKRYHFNFCVGVYVGVYAHH